MRVNCAITGRSSNRSTPPLAKNWNVTEIACGSPQAAISAGIVVVARMDVQELVHVRHPDPVGLADHLSGARASFSASIW